MNFTHAAYLNLPLYNADPDILGFSKVSGLYGPGAWAAWFLILCSSWYSLLTQSKSKTTNICFYLIPLNAVAVDYIQHFNTLRSLQNSSNLDWTQQTASMGASYNVIWWGLCACIAQLLCMWCLSPLTLPSDVSSHFALLVIGAIIPSIASGVYPWLMDEDTYIHIPAQYWKGIETTTFRNNRQSSTMLGLWFLAVCSLVILYAIYSYLNQKRTQIYPHSTLYLEKVRGFFRINSRRLPCLFPEGAVFGPILVCYLIVTAPPAFVCIIWQYITGNAPLWLLGPLLLTLACLAFWTLILLAIPLLVLGYLITSIKYSFNAYIKHPSIHNESCYFMPCAPQSIGDFDQTMALLTGLFTLFVVEIGFPLWKRRQEAMRAKLVFEQQATQRFELGRMAQNV